MLQVIVGALVVLTFATISESFSVWPGQSVWKSASTARSLSPSTTNQVLQSPKSIADPIRAVAYDPQYNSDISALHLSSKQQQEYRDSLKRHLFAVCASCDRGFTAVPVDRLEVNRLVKQLQQLNPLANTTKNFAPRIYSNEEETPLEGTWKMIYTSAYDVCALATNPLTIVQGVYQVIARDGCGVNVIDIAPRPQALLPPSLIGEGTTLRLKVHIRADAESDTRVGFSYHRIEAKPLKFFNFDADLVPSVSARLPKFVLKNIVTELRKWRLFKTLDEHSESGEELPPTKEPPRSRHANHIDIVYLDGDTLIVKQDGGQYFVSVRSTEPAHHSF
jgi:hypothetical protein